MFLDALAQIRREKLKPINFAPSPNRLNNINSDVVNVKPKNFQKYIPNKASSLDPVG